VLGGDPKNSDDSPNIGAHHGAPMLGGYLKSSDDSPNTRERERVPNTLKHKVRAQRDCDSLCR
jgi:hypothetical protein